MIFFGKPLRTFPDHALAARIGRTPVKAPTDAQKKQMVAAISNRSATAVAKKHRSAIFMEVPSMPIDVPFLNALSSPALTYLKGHSA